MIGYVILGTNNLQQAGRFYDDLLHELGGKRYMESHNFIAWVNSKTGTGTLLGIHVPYDGKPATVGNGVMVGLVANSPSQVDRIYHLAMSQGASDEGAPGYRDDDFYAAYFRDPDGNKLNAHHVRSTASSEKT